LSPKDAPATILCLRHAQSMDNVTRIYASRAPGLGLTEAGQGQAAALGNALAGENIVAVYSSTALRAAQTAQAIADGHGLAVQQVPGLLEFGLGEIEGTPILDRDDPTLAVFRQWVTRDRLDVRLPGGESGREVCDRMAAALTTIAEANADAGPAVVVSHVGSLTLGLLHLCRNLTADQVWARPLPNAVPLTLTRDSTGWQCSPWPV
jgi:broad specificity phosphatase PhoE